MNDGFKKARKGGGLDPKANGKQVIPTQHAIVPNSTKGKLRQESQKVTGTWNVGANARKKKALGISPSRSIDGWFFTTLLTLSITIGYWDCSLRVGLLYTKYHIPMHVG
jgi:hypothetical protein